MCSYQNIGGDTTSNLQNGNWEEELWATVFSPNNTASDTSSCQSQFSETSSTQAVTRENDVSTTTLLDHQMPISTTYQNVESTSFVSPTSEGSALKTPNHSINMSTYFSTFNPSSQLQDIQIHQSPVTMASSDFETQNTTGNTKMHRARISLVPSGNGTFKAIVKRKRKRTVFTTEQVEILEQVFSKKPYVTRDERLSLVEKLQVNDKSVKVWFQNRRLKYKKGDNQDEVMQAGNNCTILDRLDLVESEINERADEFGYVTLDDKIMADLVSVIDDYFSNNVSPVESKMDTNDSPVYEPISPASTSDYSCEENATTWQHYEPNDSNQNLLHLE